VESARQVSKREVSRSGPVALSGALPEAFASTTLSSRLRFSGAGDSTKRRGVPFGTSGRFELPRNQIDSPPVIPLEGI
jgi:hypothetical protein